MKVSELRDNLFLQYFEGNGILLSDLMSDLAVIRDKYDLLHKILEENEVIDSYNLIENIKEVRYNGINYLIIKLTYFKYIVIDLDNMKTLNEDEFFGVFDVEFFIQNYIDRSLKGNKGYFEFFDCVEYKGNIGDLLSLYYENKEIFELTNRIYYINRLGDAWTSLSVDLTSYSNSVQINFQTKDQFLYEQLYINSDLRPSGMQDAVGKIGEERIRSMFERVPNIVVPVSVIPKDLLDSGLINVDKNKIKKVLNKG